MQPRHTNLRQSDHSPWTNAFRSSPYHQAGDYDHSVPYADETQEPTWHALATIFGTPEDAYSPSDFATE